MKKAVIVAICVCAVAVICVAAFYLLKDKPRTGETLTSGKPAATSGPAPRQTTKWAEPTTHPSAAKWIGAGTYIDKNNRMIGVYDTDGDGIFDVDEICRYGTLRYNPGNEMNAPRIDAPLPVIDPKDTDGDGLPDAWEMGYFGHLRYGPSDDPNEDGFPLIVELNTGLSPVVPNFIDPKYKPARLQKNPSAFTTDSVEFWQKQEQAAERVKKGQAASEPAVKGFVWKKPAPKTMPSVTPIITRDMANKQKWHEMAKHPLKLEEDMDHDGLPDEWEKLNFGTLRYGKYDDPDGDGFPNVIEWYRGTDPSKPDILDDRFKPSELEDMPAPQNPWDLRWDIHSREFWDAQDRLREKMGKPKTRSSL